MRRLTQCHGGLASVNIMLSSLLSDCTAPDSGTPVTSLYWTASALLLVSLGLPWPHPHSAASTAPLRVWSRLLLSLTHLGLAAWAYSDLCSVQLFSWHSLLFLVSLAKFSEVKTPTNCQTNLITQIFQELWRWWPSSLPSSVEDLYKELFQPLGILREDFVSLINDST